MIAELFGVDDRARMDAALAIRFSVFVDEQHVPAEEEVDAYDRGGSEARHALVRDDAWNALAAGRYFPLDAERIHIARMAVRASSAVGVGGYLLEPLPGDGRWRGFQRGQLNA